MKNIILTLFASILLSIANNQLIAQSKSIKTDTITIQGNCSQCKERIEDAAFIKGVKHAEWNKTNKILTVSYNASKTSLDKITESIAKAGHDSEKHKSSDKDYKKLPECCAYRDGVCHHD